MKSVLTEKQEQKFEKVFTEDGHQKLLIVTIRYDDSCGNGHNSLSITGEVWEATREGKKKGRDCESCGCIHDIIIRELPHLEKYIKWHLTSTDGPLYYLENAKYWAGFNPRWCDGKPDSPPNINHLKNRIVWGGAPGFDISESKLKAKNWDQLSMFLVERYPELMDNFALTIKELGFTY